MNSISSQLRARETAKHLATRKRIMENGRIDCWMLGDCRLSVLSRNGYTRKSPNVKKEDIRIATLSPHFGLLTLLSIGARKGFRSKGSNSWLGYRRLEVSIFSEPAKTQAWVLNTIFRSSPVSQVRLDMSPSISLKTVFLTPFGRKVGDVCAILNLFQNLNQENLRHSYYSLRTTGENWLGWRLLSDRLETLRMQSVKSALGSQTL